MYCNQCGYEMKEGANFCKKCGAPMDDTDGGIFDKLSRITKFIYTYKKRILLIFITVLVLCGAVIGAISVIGGMNSKKEVKKEAAVPVKKTVSSVDLKEIYRIEDNRLVLDPLHAAYSDGTVQELLDYDVYIDTVLCAAEENAINAGELYDGMHLVRLVWTWDGRNYEYEKSVNLEHKKDTWAKYVDLTGMTGKEIADAYGSLGEPEFTEFGEEKWGYAYVDVSQLSLKVCFPAGVFERDEDYSRSDARCVEMTGPISSFFYNMEPEMSLEDLSSILGMKSLRASEEGGCTGTFSNGSKLFIGAGEVKDGIYTPDTTVHIMASDANQEKIWERLF